MADELKPCPFCGGNAMLLSDSQRMVWQVQCADCGASGRNGAQTEAATTWNTRHTPDVQAAIDAALESVADLLDSGDDWNTGDEIAEFIRSRIRSNPLADLQIQRSQEIAELREEADKWHSEVEVSRARIAELERELAEARKDAFSAGYEKAHDDTVEGLYSPEQSCDDYMAAMLAEREKE